MAGSAYRAAHGFPPLYSPVGTPLGSYELAGNLSASVAAGWRPDGSHAGAGRGAVAQQAKAMAQQAQPAQQA